MIRAVGIVVAPHEAPPRRYLIVQIGVIGDGPDPEIVVEQHRGGLRLTVEFGKVGIAKSANVIDRRAVGDGQFGDGRKAEIQVAGRNRTIGVAKSDHVLDPCRRGRLRALINDESVPASGISEPAVQMKYSPVRENGGSPVGIRSVIRITRLKAV